MPRVRSKHSTNSQPALPRHPFDVLHGIDTSGLIPAEQLRTGLSADRFVTAYYGVAPSILRAAINLWQSRCHPPLPIDHYTFVDIGAGKGRAMILAAEAPFREVFGIELTSSMAAIARSNFHVVQARPNHLLAPIRLVEDDALAAPLPAGPLLVYLFHPFEAPAVRRLARRLLRQSAAFPGQIDLIYINAEHAVELTRDPRVIALWQGRIPMSPEDHVADLQEIATQIDYGSTGDESCLILRFYGQASSNGQNPASNCQPGRSTLCSL